MRSAAALAPAFDDVAQVRYSRSGTSEAARRPNQDFEPTGSSATTVRASRIASWLISTHADDDVVAWVGHGAIGALTLETIIAPQRAAQLADYPTGTEPWWFNLANTSTSMIEIHPNSCEVHWINRVDHLVVAGMVHGARASATGNPGTR